MLASGTRKGTVTPLVNARAKAGLLAAFAGLIALAGSAIFASGSVNAQEFANVEAAAEDGFGRLVLTFPENMPDYALRVSTGVVVIEFDQSFAINAARIADGMPGYVAAARTDPDGGALRIALAQPVMVNTIEAGEQLFVDLLPLDWVGRPPGLPQEVIDALARRAEESEQRRAERERAERIRNAPEIDLRIGRLPTLTRLVFDWPEPVSARIERDFSRVRIVFEDFGKLDSAGRLSQFPDYILSIDAENGARGLEVTLEVDPESSVRGFKEEASYVLDVAEPSADEGVIPLGLPDPSGSAEHVVRFEGDVPDTGPAAEGQRLPSPGEITTEIRPLDGETGGTAADEGAATQELFDVRGMPDGESAAQLADEDDDTIRVEARKFGTSVRLVFPFEEETSSAVFAHGGALWLVFDSARPLDTRILRHELGDMVSGVETSGGGDRTTVRLVLERPVLTSVHTDQAAWIVTIGDSILDTPTALELERGEDFDGAPVVTAGLPGAQRIHEMVDPESGERLAVATGFAPAHGIVKQHRFVDFALLPSIHGVVVRKIVDDLVVTLDETTVQIARPGGLTLSETALAVRNHAGGISADQAARPGFVDIDADGVLDPGVVHRLITGYVKAAAEAEEEDKTAARLQLARALLATDLGAEGLAQLRLIAEEDPAVLRQAEVRALRGVALTLMHRPEEALAEFDMHGLSRSTDVSLWKGVAEAQRGNWNEAGIALDRGEPALSSYSAGRQRMFGLVGVRVALERGDTATAAVRLAQLRDIAQPNDPEIALLEGRMAEIFGDSTQALAAYQGVIRNGAPLSQAEARLRQTILMHKSGQIDAKEAIDRLETLTVLWRGDEIELTALQHLARLFADSGNYRRAFEVMKTATIVDGHSRRTREIQDEMNLVFEGLFLEGGADDMAPLDALALYYDFRELTPIGRKGDEIIRLLADRLVAVDLLDQAADLLAHQVHNRLSGAARAQVAARLAMVHLLNRKPDEALGVLVRTRQSVLPRAIQRQRALLEARALMETGRYDLALDLLDSLGDESDIKRLRADVYWQAERWQDAGEAYERVLGDSWDGRSPLSGTEQQDVLRSSIAYSLAEDQLGLDRLRTKFLAQMSESDSARAFDAVTKPQEERTGEFQDVVRDIAAVDTLEAFLDEYRSRHGAGLDPEEQGQS
jgi:tetratricopeptide (TPR) repeat protein